jgi:putative IMPACT (imprinted ancient) family translation regulator
MQVSLDIFDKTVPDSAPVFRTDVRIDRGSRYGFGYAKVSGKSEIQDFLKLVRQTKPFVSADHNSYAFRVRSPEGILVEGKGDDGESGAGQCILRELQRGEVEQCCLVVSRHF